MRLDQKPLSSFVYLSFLTVLNFVSLNFNRLQTLTENE